MAFNRIDQSFPRNRKTLRLASRLRLKPSELSARHQVMGHLVTFWLWALDNASAEGRLTGVSDEEIAAAAEWNGDAHRFVSALLDCGFLERDMDSTDIFIHDWPEYGGRLVSERMSERIRSQIRRASRDHRSPGGQPADDRQTTSKRPVAEQRRVEKSREEQSREIAAAAAAPPDEDFPEDALSETDEAVSRLCRSWENATGTTVTRSVGDAFAAWLEKLPEAALVKAIAETGASGSKAWRYCEAILQRYAVDGWQDGAPGPATNEFATSQARWEAMKRQATERGVA